MIRQQGKKDWNKSKCRLLCTDKQVSEKQADTECRCQAGQCHIQHQQLPTAAGMPEEQRGQGFGVTKAGCQACKATLEGYLQHLFLLISQPRLRGLLEPQNSPLGEGVSSKAPRNGLFAERPQSQRGNTTDSRFSHWAAAYCTQAQSSAGTDSSELGIWCQPPWSLKAEQDWATGEWEICF